VQGQPKKKKIFGFFFFFLDCAQIEIVPKARDIATSNGTNVDNLKHRTIDLDVVEHGRCGALSQSDSHR
jgi:hypothetical protein